MRVVVVVGLVIALSSCPASKPIARAHRVASRAELIGGPRALGEIGDWMIENGKVRFIVQDAGFSRGFGVFGGALLDADLVRESTGRGNSEGGAGKDNFGEMFPAFFLEALEPREVADPNNPGQLLPPIAIENDGSDGQPAVLVIRGNGGDFIALTQRVNELLLDDSRQTPNLFLESRYILEPDAGFLKMTTRVVNVKAPAASIELPNFKFGDAQVPTPFGDVVLFGGGNKVFTPHPAGFDVRFTLEDIYADNDIQLPALPGITAEFVASAGKDVSYGLLAEAPTAPTTNFVQSNSDQFPGATDHSIHIPFIASAFTGVFQVLPPPVLTPNDGVDGGSDEMTYTRYFMVGDGDVASITDTVYAILGDETGSLTGRLRMDGSGEGMVGASIMVVGADGAKVTQMKTDEGGRFSANLRPGTYTLRTVMEGFATQTTEGVAIKAAADTRAELTLPQPATLVVTVVEGGVAGGRVPAKVSLIGQVPPEHIGERPRDWLFDLSVGEEFRYTDLVDDVAGDPSTLQYIEHFQYTTDGTLTMKVRPGTYKVVAGRGPEYDRVEQDVILDSGTTKTLTMEINRVVNTDGYVGADFHLHTVFSLDSNAGLKDRIASYAGEGVEYAVSTDHNFIVDYRATIEKLGLERFINSSVGLELTTIDRGHFNGFPLDRGDGSLLADDDEDIANTIKSRTYGSFEWALRDPADIFQDLRQLGRKDSSGAVLPIIVQVNHPRDSILGYFDQYGVSADTMEPLGQGGAILGPQTATHPEFGADRFSYGFDALEVFNGKRFEFLQTFKVPPGSTRDPVSCCPLTPGDVVRDLQAPECSDDVPSDQCNCALSSCQGDVAGAACDARQQAQLAAGRCNPGGRDIAFPGVVDDWMRLLSTGRHIVGTANSDSHEAEKEEPGSPRSYIRVPSDSPAQVSPDDVVAAFNAGDLLMTNGPFVRVDVGGKGMGQTVTGANLTLNINVQQAPWVKADTIHIYANEELVKTVAFEGNKTFSVEVPPFTSDGFLVVEVLSTAQSASLFPSVYPNEVAPVQFTDVLGALGSSLGLASVEGALEPELIFVTTPYALTNPIWVDFDGDGAVTPSRSIPNVDEQGAQQPQTVRETPTVSPRVLVTVPTETEANQAAARAAWDALPIKRKLALKRLPQWLWPSNDPRDIRRVLVQFVRHAH